MAELAGDTHAASTANQSKVLIADAQQPGNINDYLHSINGLRHNDSTPNSGFDPGKLKLTGLDGVGQTKAPPEGTAKVPPADTTGLPGLTISHPENNGGAAAALPPKPTAQPEVDSESTAKKVGRETAVLGLGLGRSVLYGMASLPSRAGDLATSVGIGASLSTLAKTSEFGAAATLFVGAYFTSRFIVSTINDTGRWSKFSDAVSDTWHSGKNFGKDIKDVSDTGGNFAFDTALSYGAGYLGYKNKALADIILGGLKIPLPAPGIPPKMPLSPELMGASMYLSIAPPPMLYHHHYQDYEDRDKPTDK
jgi:hypothetical protein